jgi:4-hydroxyphenylpyruvate dioxygenase
MSTRDSAMPHAAKDDVELIYWAAGSAFRNAPFAEHLDIAEAGRFDSLAVSPMTFKKLSAQGLTADDILALAGERDLNLTQLDGVTTWVENWHPAADTSGNRFLRAAFDVEMEEALDIAQALKMRSAVAVGFFDAGSIPTDEIVEAFAGFCDSAKTRGISVDLEFIPMWGIRELPLAWHIVKTADRANSGVCVDTWHMQMGSSDFERDIALLETIPGERLTNVQLVDADLRLKPTALEGGGAPRKFPGEGDLDITRILSIIEAKGGLRSVGPEIVGKRLADPPAEVGRAAGATTREALARAYAANGKKKGARTPA